MSEILYRRTITDTWEPKTWNGLTSLYGSDVWTDGTDTYYSNGAGHYVLDKFTNTWSQKTWNGLTSFRGENVWTDGTDIYYSSSSNQYVLDKATSTWSQKTWSGRTSFDGRYIWTDGTDIYYSNSTSQYALDKSTNTWSQKTWNGLTSFYGYNIWTDGTDIYYSTGATDGTRQYKLNKSTGTWEQKTWNGLTDFYGQYVWTDGTSIYYSSSSSSYQYVLDKSTSTWSQKTWNGLTSFNGNNIYIDGTDIYCNDGSSQYKLIAIYEPVTIPESIKVKDRGGIWHPVKGISVRTHGGSGAAEVKLDTQVPCLTANGEVVIMYDSEGNILAHKSDIGNVAALTRFAMYEIRNVYLGETCPFDTSDVNAEQVSSIYVDGDGYLAYNDVDDTEGENPRQMLEWDSLNEATIDFASIAGYPRYS